MGSELQHQKIEDEVGTTSTHFMEARRSAGNEFPIKNKSGAEAPLMFFDN